MAIARASSLLFRFAPIVSAGAFVLAGGTAVASDASARPVAGAASATSSQLSLITEPNQGVAPVLDAVQHARRSVDVVMYELEDKPLEAALVVDEGHGVHVRVLLNGGYYGEGSSQNRAAYAYLKAHRVPVRWTPKHFALTHQKTVVVDDRAALILTFNLTPQYHSSSRDFGIADSNPADVRAIEGTFANDWNGAEATAGDGSGDLVWSPGSESTQIQTIDSARGELDIYNEEMDDTAVENALEQAARRGVDVRVVMTYSPDWKSALEALAAAGVHVRTYTTDASLYIHAKMILSGGRALVESENFSTTSLDRNRELGITVASPRIVSSLKATFEHDYAGAAPFMKKSSTPKGSAAECSVTASYSARYGDWDVYVHSDLPGQTATVTDSSGQSDSYHTSSVGYADVYFKAPESAAGETVTVRVGSAACTAKL
ncbi:MAG TPA: phospholipase D-like domain-containing protein [Solirubrobacteraceae bacterium]